MDAFISMGVGKDTIQELRKMIMDILNCKTADQETKIRALDVASKVCSVNNITVSECTFNSK